MVVSFKEYYLTENVLQRLIDKHDNPLAFAKDATEMMRKGTLKLKERGASNMRELIRIFYIRKKGVETRVKERTIE
jgi:hypothetical protein